MEKVLKVIYPSRCEGVLVFDDDGVGLVRELFVEGTALSLIGPLR